MKFSYFLISIIFTILLANPILSYASPTDGFDSTKLVTGDVDEAKYKNEMVLVKVENGKIVCRLVTVEKVKPDNNKNHHRLDVYGCDIYETGTATQ